MPAPAQVKPKPKPKPKPVVKGKESGAPAGEDAAKAAQRQRREELLAEAEHLRLEIQADTEGGAEESSSSAEPEAAVPSAETRPAQKSQVRRAKTKPGHGATNPNAPHNIQAEQARRKKAEEKEDDAHADSDYMPERAPSPPPKKKTSKKGKKKEEEAAGGSGEETTKKKHSQWAFPVGISSTLMNLHRSKKEIYAHGAKHKHLEVEDVFSLLNVHGIRDDADPLLMEVRH